MGNESGKSPMIRLIVAISGGLIFFVLNIFLPYMKIMFGFLEDSRFGWTIRYYATEVNAKHEDVVAEITWNYDEYGRSLRKEAVGELEFTWTFLDLWQWVFLVGGIIALILVILPELINMTRRELPELPVSLSMTGFIIGLIASGAEWLLFLFLWLEEDWDDQPDIGFSLLILNIIGFVTLYVASKPSLLIKEQ